MNPYQRAAVLVVRCTGFIGLIMGIPGFFYIPFMLGDAEQAWSQCLNSLYWSIGGGVVMGIARPVGRWLGRDLGADSVVPSLPVAGERDAA